VEPLTGAAATTANGINGTNGTNGTSTTESATDGIADVEVFTLKLAAKHTGSNFCYDTEVAADETFDDDDDAQAADDAATDDDGGWIDQCPVLREVGR
jgi:hypothetical protein